MEESALTALAMQVLCAVVSLENSDELLLFSAEWPPLGAAVATATMRAKKTTIVVFILKV